MTKTELNSATALAIEQTRAALQTVYDALNPGQKKQIVKDEAVAELFARYGVEVSDLENEH